MSDGVIRFAVDNQQDQLVSAANPLPALSGGPAASGAAASGNPVPMGMDYNTTQPTVTNGQRVTAQADSRGNLKVTLMSGVTAAGMTVASVTALVSAALAGVDVIAHSYKSDGTGWRADSRPSGASRIPSAAATTNATVAKASAGDLHVITGYNAAASVRYIKVYNKATAPTVGTDTPVLTYALAASSTFNIDSGGFYCSAGISYAMTTGAADADTGALTLADVVGLNVTYA